MTPHTHCRICHESLPGPWQRTYDQRRGFCSRACRIAGAPPLRFTATCSACAQPFESARRDAAYCSAKCRKRWSSRKAKVAARAVGRPGGMVDLPADVIEAKLAAMAARRKATRSWLRITDPYAQRPGSELHNMMDAGEGL